MGIGAAPDTPDTLARCQEIVRPALQNAIGKLHPWLGRMASFTLGWSEADGTPRPGDGGKGLRPALAVLSARAVGAPAEAAVAGAVAVELVHAFSLVHDDIMDGDERRRHAETVWKAYGVGPAVLAGDALLALAMETVSAGGARAARQLSTALVELVQGQAEDVYFENRPWTGPGAVSVEEYCGMAVRKTGSLLASACALGAALGDADDEVVAAMSRVGRHLGLAFQAIDDLLGIWGDPLVTGKPVHSDLRKRKKSLPVLAALAGTTPAGRRLGELLAAPETPGFAELAAALIEETGARERTRALADLETDRARRILMSTRLDPIAAGELVALSDFLVNRDR
jgi:geranylgeranyl diphosphate synthase type I